MHLINVLAHMSPSLYVSVLGQMLSRNVERMQKQRTDLNHAEAVLLAITERLMAIVDDVLLAYDSMVVQRYQMHKPPLSAPHVKWFKMYNIQTSQGF